MRSALFLIFGSGLPFIIIVSFAVFCCAKGQMAYNALGVFVISSLLLFWLLRYRTKN